MRNSKASLGFMVILLILLCSCSPKGVSTQQIERDINNIDFSNFTFKSNFVEEAPFEFIPNEIIKRQTNLDKKEDIVFYDVSARNLYFEIDLSVKLLYNFYDDGGWILDESVITLEDVSAIRVPESNMIIDYITGMLGTIPYTEDMNGSDFNNGQISNINLYNAEITSNGISLDESNCNAVLDMRVSAGEFVQLSGIIQLTLTEESGWTFASDASLSGSIYADYPLFIINESVYNFELAKGYFIAKPSDIVALHISVDDIYLDQKQVSVSGNIFYFDPLRTNRLVDRTYNDWEFYYSTVDDAWIAEDNTNNIVIYYRSN